MRGPTLAVEPDITRTRPDLASELEISAAKVLERASEGLSRPARVTAELDHAIEPPVPKDRGAVIQSMPESRAKIFAMINDRLLEEMKKGTLPWQIPFHADARPRNYDGRPYTGLNKLLLGMVGHIKGYPTPHWLTFNKAKDLGGAVLKGEKSVPVVFWKVLQKERNGTELEKAQRHRDAKHLDLTDDELRQKSIPIIPEAGDPPPSGGG